MLHGENLRVLILEANTSETASPASLARESRELPRMILRGEPRELEMVPAADIPDVPVGSIVTTPVFASGTA